jgi:hypothetical protein
VQWFLPSAVCCSQPPQTGTNLAPGNTLAAFARGCREGANGIELDVHGTAASEWMGGLDVDSVGGSVPRAIRAIGGRNWSPNAGNVTRERVEEAHRLGVRVFPWTVNDTTEMRRLLDLGVDGITTDRPVLLRALLRREPSRDGRYAADGSTVRHHAVPRCAYSYNRTTRAWRHRAIGIVRRASAGVASRADAPPGCCAYVESDAGIGR